MKVALGLGCDRGTPLDTFEQAVTRALVEVACATAGPTAGGGHGQHRPQGRRDRLLALACDRGWPLRFFPPQVLAAVPVPNPSETVRRYTGTLGQRGRGPAGGGRPRPGGPAAREAARGRRRPQRHRVGPPNPDPGENA
jgi:cobalt-precorrin 5A hydrolase